MSGLHPVFAQILGSICPSGTPPCPAGVHEHVFDTDLGEVIAWFDHQPAERQTLDDPGCPESLSLTHVWLEDLDLHSRVPDCVKEYIERDALAALVRNREESLTEVRLEHWTRRMA